MTRLDVRPDGGCAGGTPPVASRKGSPTVRSARPTALTVALLGDCELVVRGLHQMLAPFSARVRIHEPVGTRGARSEAVNGSTSPDIILFDCYPSGVHDGVLRALPAPAAPTAW